MSHYSFVGVLALVLARVFGDITLFRQRDRFIPYEGRLWSGARTVWGRKAGRGWPRWGVRDTIDGFCIEHTILVHGNGIRLVADNMEWSNGTA